MMAKSGPLRKESKSELFSASGDPQESANGTLKNVFEVHLMLQFRVHLIIHPESHPKVYFKTYIKMHKKGAPENAVKGALQVALVHLIVNA